MSDHPGTVAVFQTRATLAHLRSIRNKRATQSQFVAAADRLCHLLAEEALASMPGSSTEVEVETPHGVWNCGVQSVPTRSVCVVDIMRSGCILLEAVRRLAPDAKTAKILIQRDEATALPQLIYSKLPPLVETMDVLLCDPMLATGGSALSAIGVLKAAGVSEERILFANVVSCPEGLRALAEHAPGVRVITTAVDEGLDAHSFIVPGLGDFGDRYYGTYGYLEGLWGETCP